MEKEIYKMMVMSTGHVSKETAELLDHDDVGVVVYKKKECGWFVVVTDWNDPLENREELIPEDLKICLEYAEQHGCDWLCLDCDGPIYEDIPSHNW